MRWTWTTWLALALAGVVLAAGVTFLATRIIGQPLEAVSAPRVSAPLAEPEAEHPPRARTRPSRPTTTRTSPTRTVTAPTQTVTAPPPATVPSSGGGDDRGGGEGGGGADD